MKLLELIGNKPFTEVKELLEGEPYRTTVSDEDNLYIIKYGIKSPFNIPLIHECRGIILEKDTNKVVCRAFDKFFNYGEFYAADIDWSTAKILEKIDGSLIKLYYYNNDWKIATNGTVNAFNAPINSNIVYNDREIQTFGELAEIALGDFDYSLLNTSYTYILEVVSLHNRIVIPYKDIGIYWLSTRLNHSPYTEDALLAGIGKQPETYVFESINDVVEAARNLDGQEGYVVVDGNYNRIKIKSPSYVALHHIMCGEMTTARIIDLVKSGESSEFLSYFPEYTERFEAVNSDVTALVNQVIEDWNRLGGSPTNIDRKEFALKAKETIMPSILFRCLDGKVSSIEHEIRRMDGKRLAGLVKDS